MFSFQLSASDSIFGDLNFASVKFWLVSFCSILFLLCVCLFFGPDQALAQSAIPSPAGPPPMGEVLLRMVPMFAMVCLIFYLMVLKPQNAKLQAHKLLMDSLKKGENVVSSGGIVGKVHLLDPQYVHLEIATNVRIRIERDHIIKIAGPVFESKSDEKAELKQENKRS